MLERWNEVHGQWIRDRDDDSSLSYLKSREKAGMRWDEREVAAISIASRLLVLACTHEAKERQHLHANEATSHTA